MNNKTPLHYAAEENSTESAQLLLERGAEVEARDINKQTPLNLARSNSGNSKAIIRLLMEHAAITSSKFNTLE